MTCQQLLTIPAWRSLCLCLFVHLPATQSIPSHCRESSTNVAKCTVNSGVSPAGSPTGECLTWKAVCHGCHQIGSVMCSSLGPVLCLWLDSWLLLILPLTVRYYYYHIIIIILTGLCYSRLVIQHASTLFLCCNWILMFWCGHFKSWLSGCIYMVDDSYITPLTITATIRLQLEEIKLNLKKKST